MGAPINFKVNFPGAFVCSKKTSALFFDVIYFDMKSTKHEYSTLNKTKSLAALAW
jgi:hypothetical protein